MSNRLTNKPPAWWNTVLAAFAVIGTVALPALPWAKVVIIAVVMVLAGFELRSIERRQKKHDEDVADHDDKAAIARKLEGSKFVQLMTEFGERQAEIAEVYKLIVANTASILEQMAALRPVQDAPPIDPARYQALNKSIRFNESILDQLVSRFQPQTKISDALWESLSAASKASKATVTTSSPHEGLET